LKRSYFPILFIFLFAGNAFCQSPAVWDSLYPTPPAGTIPPKNQTSYTTGKFEITERLGMYLDSIALKDLKANRITGYRILLYSGNERETATKARELAYRIFQKANIYTTFQSPTFKVRLGDYYQKLDAYLDLKKLEQAFPQAVIVQEIVNLKP
jgi:hypothetical protein